MAHEMEREGFTMPLLIGGATTSRVHTAVKIAPNYSGVTVYVPDASRAVGVCSSLLSDELRDEYARSVRADYDKIRAQHQSKQRAPALLSLAQARANAFDTDWSAYAPPAPRFIGVREFRDYDLAAIARHIDWSPFFQTWELSGPYPKILDDPLVGEAARNVFAEGQAMLAKIIAEKWLVANARHRIVSRQQRRRRHRDLRRRIAQPGRDALAQPAPAERSGRRASRITVSPISSRRRARA